ncbi:MAG: beta-ketoacyl synthase N-terminal-like domain-containing protein [Myxococcaceae bacterium]
MSEGVVISAFATWTPGGVSVGKVPVLGGGRVLGPWPGAPELSKIHPRARRPHAAAKVLVQLAHALLADRDSRGPLPRAGVGLAIGSLAGCAAADAEFAAGLATRGLGFGSPATFVYTLPSAPPGEVSIALGLKGGLFTVSAGAGSGLAAVVSGAALVAARRCPGCLCGAVEVAPPDWPGPDSVSLFLLEPEGAAPAKARLLAWRAGFGPPPGPAGEGDPLHALARAASGADGEASLIVSVSPEGYWASVGVDRTRTAPVESS